MKSLLKPLRILPIMAGILFIASCGNDDGTVKPPKEEEIEEPEVETPVTETASKTYNLGAVANPDISGTARFATFSNDSTVVELKLENTPDGGMHPAHIHFNTAAEGGDIALDLTTVDGATGESSTHVTALKDGTAITYEQLLEYDGYINVHLSEDDLATLVAQGDIGQNELTDTSKEYALGSVSDPNIDGTATFTKRVNGEALAVLALSNTPADGMHPAHIHANTAVEGGGIVFDFTIVNGETGISKTNVAELKDGTPFLYDDVLEYDGYINVHLSMDDLATLVAQGDIGQNQLTGESKAYTLNSVAIEDIDGTATFFERVNGEALAIVMLNNTPADGMHPGHIHENSAAEGGGILFTFNPVIGATGISKTNVDALDDDTAFGYADVLTIDGYINIHLSIDDLATLVAQGDIGANEGDDGEEEEEETAINFAVTNQGASAYVFNGNGLTDASNPNIALKRGETYTFTINTPGHPFFIKAIQSTNNTDTYDTGVTNNGDQDGVITFVVPMDAPDTLFYNCEFHMSMTGEFNITD